MVGRLSTYAKNRILNLRFQKSYKIKHIAHTLLQEDNIKVSRESISTFLKKYIDTKSIDDKPRSGRNKKLNSEEINLIGEITRLNPDITAPKIKQLLNLDVSTHTILRASKLFEWNKYNPNSNEAKRAAALERQLRGESVKKRKNRNQKANSLDGDNDEKKNELMSVIKNGQILSNEISIEKSRMKNEGTINEKLEENHNLNLLTDKEVLSIKNQSSSPMVFATKILIILFKPDELHGHNVSGKTFSRHIKNKKALDEKRINYIRWLIENNFQDHENKENLWKMCRTAINKIILINEKKAAKQNSGVSKKDTKNDTSSEMEIETKLGKNSTSIYFNSLIANQNKFNSNLNQVKLTPVCSIKKYLQAEFVQDKKLSLLSKTTKVYEESDSCTDESISLDDSSYDLKLLNEKEIVLIKNLYCSPMIFSTKILAKIFTPDELRGHNLTSKPFHKNSTIKPVLDEKRFNYIKWLVGKYFESKNKSQVWKSCRKAMCRVIRNLDKQTTKPTGSDGDLMDSTNEKSHTLILLMNDTEKQKEMLIRRQAERDASIGEAKNEDFKSNFQKISLVNPVV